MALFGERVKELRRRRNLTQETIANEAGVNLRQYQKYEAGESDPSTEIAGRIAKVLNTTLDYLAGITNEPGPRLIETELAGDERDLIIAVRELDTDALLQVVARIARNRSSDK